MGSIIDKLRNIFLERLASTSLEFKRYMHDAFDMQDRLIGIIGPRGVGKTTFILQYLRELDVPIEKKLYFNADHFYVASSSLFEIAEEFHKQGGEVLAIDEIHKYAEFQRELKSIYDSFDLKVIFSGSSALTLENAKYDLSRRAVLYRVQGLSFREFIAFETGKELPRYTLEEILSDHTRIAYGIKEEIKPFEFFSNYLRYGYYPFYKENIRHYALKLNEIVNTVLESDLPMVFNIEARKIFKLKKLLAMLCQSKPYELNITKLSQRIELNRVTLYHYLDYLEKGSLIQTVGPLSKGDRIFTKPEKLYMHNTNLTYSYCDSGEIGTIREQFFVNQLSFGHSVHYVKHGDFLVDQTATFEIGGKHKGFGQIREEENAFVAADDIEVGFGNKIPLWLFGFLY